MPNSKMFFRSILVFTSLVMSSAMAVTPEDAAQIVESSKSDAVAAAQEKKTKILQLSQEIRILQDQVTKAEAEMDKDRLRRDISFGISAGGAVAIGYIFGRGPKGGERGAQELGNIINSIFLGGVTIAAAGTGSAFQYMISIDKDKIDNFKARLSTAQQNLVTAALN